MKDEPFKISAAVSDDISRIAQLERLCFSEPWSVQSLTACCKNPEYIFFTAKDKNENIAGYCSMRYVLDEAEICNVAVDAKYRRMGAASALVREIIKTACELHLKSISLEVRESNEAAISLYEKFGFNRSGVRRGFYEKPREDAFIMTKQIEGKTEEI